MTQQLQTAKVAAAGQLSSFKRSPVMALLAVLLPINLLLLMSLFALTGYRAPTALVVDDVSPEAAKFVDALDAAHHSFALRPMTAPRAEDELKAGRVVAVINIPNGFGAAVKEGASPFVTMTVDNVNLDMAEDVRRAVPAAAAIFAKDMGRTVNVEPQLRNVLPRETNYVEYLGVSAIALAAVIAGATLGGTVTSRTWESGEDRLLRTAPSGAGAALLGRLAAAGLVSLGASVLTALIVVWGYGVPMKSPMLVFLTIAILTACSVALGGLLGAALKRTLLIVPLVVGITLPFYLDSGALEPQRFDGEFLFWLAHLSPTYWGVGAIEHAFHGLKVTPEPVWLLLAVLAAATAAACAGVVRLASR
jgi:ABC-type multidrug transport system permease subunit